MLKPINPPTIAPPFSRYSQAIEVPAGARWLHISGQVGVRPDGTLEQGFTAQAERAWDNLLAILAAAGMGPADVVKANVYLTRGSDLAESRRIRDAKLAGAAPASTLAVVAALANPAWLFEVEAVAAKA
jgi:enamine deaminase RidA (YjgF/YER057c/UK114 family)